MKVLIGGTSLKLEIERAGDVGPAQAPQSLVSTSVMEGLLIQFFTYLVGIPSSTQGVPLVLSMVPLLVAVSTYDISLIFSVCMSPILISAYGIP